MTAHGRPTTTFVALEGGVTWWRGTPPGGTAPEGVPAYLTDSPFIAAWYAGPGGTVRGARPVPGTRVVDFAGMRDRHGHETFPDPAVLASPDGGPEPDDREWGLQARRLAAIRACGADGFLRRETWGWAWGDRSCEPWASWTHGGGRVLDLLRRAPRDTHMALGMDGLGRFVSLSEEPSDAVLARAIACAQGPFGEAAS